MEFLDYQLLQCPYCGEQIEITIDSSAGDQQYIEDCSVCCRPIELTLVQGVEGPQLLARRDDE
jgi:hypothetical protein